MKNRNGLVFALCVMMGAAGTLACSNESGDSGLVIEPESVSLAAYGTQSVKISGATASTAITVTSGNSACVSVNNADNLLADANGMANFLLAAANTDGKKCDTVITVTADGETKVINASVAEATGPAPTGDFVLTLDPNILDISGVGGEASTKITYKQGETPATGRTLKVSKVGGEDGCVEFSTSPITNLNNGTVDFKVKALKDSCNVKLLIEDALPSITGEEKELSVYVGGKTDQKIEGQVFFIEPSDGKLFVNESDGTGSFAIQVLDGNSNALSTNVILTNSNPSCIGRVAKSLKTDNDGKASGTFEILSSDCQSTIKASALGTEDEIVVSVVRDQYTVKVDLSFNHPLHSVLGYAAVATTNQPCSYWMAQETYPQILLGLSTDAETEDISTDKPKVASFTVESIDSDPEVVKSIVGYAKANGNIKTPILAYNCQDISVENHWFDKDDTIALNLNAVPIELKGEYALVSNFDIAGAFTKDASVELPYVENMIADDWIKFVTDFFKYPVKTLIDFIWVNSIARLSTLVDDDGGVLSKILGLLNDPNLKTLVFGALEPMIEEALKDYGWFTTFDTLSPDIEDLVSNMQLAGTMTVTETEVAGDQLEVVQAKQSYDTLQYRWSLEENRNNCDANIYGKDGECRMKMSLKKAGIHDASIEGSWTGLTRMGDDEVTVLDINDHELALKWANILYMAVFGEILPKAMSEYYNATTVEKGLYIKAFLEAILFKPVVESYKKNQKLYCDCEGVETVNQTCELKSGADAKNLKYCQSLTTKDYCERFIESLVYMIAETGSDYSGVIATVAGLACDTNLQPGDEPKAIGKLDTLVNNSLAGLQVKFNTSADSCVLDSKATTQYMSMGEPDELAYSANDVFKNGSNIESTRCTWNMDITSSHSMNGLFHATRIED